MKSVRYAILAAALAAAACNNEATDPEHDGASLLQVQAGDTIRLRVGQSARIGNTGVQVAFRGIAQDSRCPIDALCVWPGDAEAKLQLRTGEGAWTSAAVHSFTDPKYADYGNYRFRLIEVSPANVSTSRTDPDDYIIALEVTSR